MIYALEGKLFNKTSTEVVVNCNGIHYLAGISLNTFEKLPAAGNPVFVFTYHQTREDGTFLFGFSDVNELELFKLLISISGIGPKSALGILSSVTPDDFHDILLSKDLNRLTKFPGIGKKTAERILFELGDKSLAIIAKFSKSDRKIGLSSNVDDAIAALTSLGYNHAVAEKSVKAVIRDGDSQNLTTEDIIKLALKFQMR